MKNLENLINELQTKEDKVCGFAKVYFRVNGELISDYGISIEKMEHLKAVIIDLFPDD